MDGLATAGLLVLLAFGAGALAARLHGTLAARAAQRRAELATSLTGAVLWETDARLQLCRWEKPPGLAFGQPGSTLSECFDAGDEGRKTLETCLRHASAFDGIEARARSDGSSWLLSARPLTNLAGRLQGFVGTALPAPGLAGHAALEALSRVDGLALVLAERDADGWWLRQANPSARTRLGLAESQPLPVTAPDAVAAWLEATGDSAQEVEGWRITPYRSDRTRGAVLTRLTDAADPGESAAFSYTVSHDLRAPIRVVEGFTRIVKEDYGPTLDRVANDHLDRVLGAVARMNQMIDAMLTLARLSSQPLARQAVNLSQLASFVVDELRRATPQREADVEIVPGIVVQGDPTLLRLVLENLLGNAWKYSAKRPVARIVFSEEMQSGRRVFVVRDNGAGFDMRSVDRLFGLFQRLHSASDFPGTGVGLASVRRIVRRHGGEIWADAEPGRGAAFQFTLGA